MDRVRLSADVEPELRRRVRIAAAKSDRKVSEWIAEAVRRELDREETETKQISTNEPITQASVRSFERDWDSEDDAAYDELAG
jgi:hypothetical protein